MESLTKLNYEYYTTIGPLLTFSQGKQLEEKLQKLEEASVCERQESEQALRIAESRASDLEQAWEVLAAKVVPLADRNADLERVSSAGSYRHASHKISGYKHKVCRHRRCRLSRVP